ncbi:MAG: alpha-mannosidase [Armatimonadota bacterium]
MTESKGALLFVPHTHWEGAVFKTREEYLDMGLPIILRALRLLKKYPQYRFVLDQAAYVKPFLERYPEEEDTLRACIADGRLAIAGGLDVMPDVNMPSGESFVRQVLYGKGYFRQMLGVDVTTGWQLDTFGHHAQMPQLLRQAGYTSFWTQRGVPDQQTPSEFIWEGIDGSRIPTYWTAQSYASTYGSPKDIEGFRAFMEARYEALGLNTQSDVRIGLAGADVCLPEEHVPVLIEELNAMPDAPFQMRIVLPSEFEAIVESRPEERQVIVGDMNPIFQGVYSSRIELKQRLREVERLLLTAEKLNSILSALGETTDDTDLWSAWEPSLFNQAHDLMSGVMTDHVYDDTILTYDMSARMASEACETRFRSLVDKIDTNGNGVPVVVFNALHWARTDVVNADVGFTDDMVSDLKILGPDGQSIPYQLIEADRSDAGSLIRAKIAFVACDVPALGYAVYHVVPQSTVSASDAVTEQATGSVLENEYYRVEVDPITGAITRLTCKDTGWDVLSGPGNVVAKEEDHGDLWELYHPLQMGFVTSKERHTAPTAETAKLSTELSGEPGTITRGPVFSEITVAHPFDENGRIQLTVRLYNTGIRRIEMRTKLVNNDRFNRYRVLFPTTIGEGRQVHEIPFGAIERPDGIECPAQNWIDYGNGERGVALINRGMPGNNTADGTMMLSLMRSTEIVAYGIGGGYEGQGSSSGFALGKEFSLDYALVPHDGGWQDAKPFRDGLAFNTPLLAMTADKHSGIMPAQWGLIDISQENVVVSALKTGKDGKLVLRVYEAAGKTADNVVITCRGTIDTAEELNLMEDPIRRLDTDGSKLTISLQPFEIKTIGLVISDVIKG